MPCPDPGAPDVAPRTSGSDIMPGAVAFAPPGRALDPAPCARPAEFGSIDSARAGAPGYDNRVGAWLDRLDGKGGMGCDEAGFTGPDEAGLMKPDGARFSC